MKNHHIQLLLMFGLDLPRHVSLQTLRDLVEIMASQNFTLTHIDVTGDETRTKKF